MTSQELPSPSHEEDETFLHKLKWGLIRANKWRMLEEHEKKEESETTEPILYEGTLEYLREKITCQLTATRIVITRANMESSSISLKNEVYCVHRDEKDDSKFYVYALLEQHKRTIFHFSAVEHETKEPYAMVSEWISRINQYMFGIEFPIEKLPQRRILIILNPLSGGRTGRHQFKDRVKAVLDDSQLAGDIMYSVINTEYAGHATKICEELDVTKWDAIGCVGGDGCTHEALSGLLQRKDWEKAIKIPLCPIPAGTSNALASSFYGSEHAMIRSAFALVRGYQKPLDVCSVIQPGQKRYYSCLTIMFGFLANVTRKFNNRCL
jgi:hypothetical protein